MYPTTACGRFVAIVAMIISLLIIAYPVSVFSDLWCQELQQAKYSNGEQEVKKETVPSDITIMKKEALEDQSNLHLQQASLSKQINFGQNDTDALLRHLSLIDESQKQIRDILKRNGI